MQHLLQHLLQHLSLSRLHQAVRSTGAAASQDRFASELLALEALFGLAQEQKASKKQARRDRGDLCRLGSDTRYPRLLHRRWRRRRGCDAKQKCKGAAKSCESSDRVVYLHKHVYVHLRTCIACRKQNKNGRCGRLPSRRRNTNSGGGAAYLDSL